MAKQLRKMKITSVDVCNRGANPLADIVITKSMEGRTHTMFKSLEGLMPSFCKSIDTTLSDTTIDDAKKLDMVKLSRIQFAKYFESALEEARAEYEEALSIAKAAPAENNDTGTAADEAAADEPADDAEAAKPTEVDKKKCGVKKSADVDPDIRKALDEVAELKKQLEINRLTGIAKAYECTGRKPDELALKLYDLKKSDMQNGTHSYDDFVALLDELKKANDDIFKEFGTSRTGTLSKAASLDAAVAEIRKSEPTLSRAQAVVKAYQLNPDLPETV